MAQVVGWLPVVECLVAIGNGSTLSSKEIEDCKYCKRGAEADFEALGRLRSLISIRSRSYGKSVQGSSYRLALPFLSLTRVVGGIAKEVLQNRSHVALEGLANAKRSTWSDHNSLWNPRT